MVVKDALTKNTDVLNDSVLPVDFSQAWKFPQSARIPTKLFWMKTGFQFKENKDFWNDDKLEYISLQKSEVSQEKNIASFNFFFLIKDSNLIIAVVSELLILREQQ